MPQDISNGLKHLSQLIGLPRSVLDFVRFHAGALYPAVNVFRGGRQQDRPLISLAEQGGSFPPPFGLCIDLIDPPHSRNHFGRSGFPVLRRQLLDGL